MMKLQAIHEAVLPVLTQAEQLLQEGFFGQVAVGFKSEEGHSHSIVTETDRRIDAFLQKELLTILPEAGWISEEDEANQPGTWRWIVDPIDGTLNYSKRIPIFGISIALWEGDQPRYGIISFPMQKERIHAIHQQGLFLNGQPLPPPTPIPMRDSYWFCSYHLVEGQQRIPILAHHMGTPPRRFDCATYELLLTALSRAQGCLLGGAAIWDIAAALLIIQESGLQYRQLTPPPRLDSPQSRAYHHALAVGDPAFIATIDKVLL
jgi:myo-inositol-1(or 4)-monophosphatase